MKLTIDELKSELLGNEYSFMELDNYMMGNGYYSVFDEDTLAIKESGSIAYTATDSNEAEIEIFFEITIDNDEDEIDEAFYLKVTNISTLQQIDPRQLITAL